MKAKKIIAILGATVVVIASSIFGYKQVTKASNTSHISMEQMDEYLQTVPVEAQETIKVYLVKLLSEENGLSSILTEEMLEEICTIVSNKLVEENYIVTNNNTSTTNEQLTEKYIQELIDNTITEKITEVIQQEITNATNNSVQNISKTEIQNITNDVKQEILNSLNGYATEDQVASMIQNAMSKNNTLTSTDVTNIIQNELQTSTTIEYLKEALQGINGKDGKDGKDGYTPVKGVDYFTDIDIDQIASESAKVVSEKHMVEVIKGVTENLMKDGEITLSTYTQDIIDTIVEILMKDQTNTDYIKDEVLQSVQQMITNSIAEAFSQGKEYHMGDVVAMNGSLYECIVETTTAAPTDNSAWKPININQIIQNLNQQMADFTIQINETMDNFSQELEDKVDNQGGKLEDAENAIADLDGKIVEHETAIADLKTKTDEHATAIAELDGKINGQDTAIADINAKNDEQDAAIADINAKNDEQDTAIADINAKNDEQDVAIADINTKNDEQDDKLDQMQEQIDKVTYSFNPTGNGTGKLTITINN